MASRGGGTGRGGHRGTQKKPPFYKPRNGVVPVPDRNVHRIEDARQAARQDPAFAMGELGLDDNTMPARPGYGTLGTPITVWANYVQLVPKSNLVLYMYDIEDIRPEVMGGKRTQIIRLMGRESAELATTRDSIVTDFKSTLISSKELQMENPFINVPYKAEGEDEPRGNALVYKVPIIFVRTLNVGEFIAYLTSTNPDVPYDSKPEMLQALNIFLNHYAKIQNNRATIGSSKTFVLGRDNVNTMNLGQGLLAIRGFFTSVRAATNRILINVNVSHGAFYQEGKLTDLINIFRAQPSGKKAEMGAVEKFLSRLRVRTTHLKEKRDRQNRIKISPKTIWGLAKPYKPAPEAPRLPNPPIVSHLGAGPKNVQFWLQQQPAHVTNGSGQYVTVYDHFKNMHRIETSDDWPVVNVGTDDNPTYLPAEVCVVLSGQTAKAQLSGEQTRNMISFAVRKPWQNANSIVNDGLGAAGLSMPANMILGRLGTVEQSLITTQARVLKEPTVRYRTKPALVAKGSWNMANQQFNKPGELKTWSYFAIRNTRGPSTYNDNEIKLAVERFTKALDSNGLDLRYQTYIEGKQVRMEESTDPVLDAMFKESKGVDLLLIILPGTQKTDAFNKEVYSYLKTLGDIKYGIHTICVIGKKFKDSQPQYFGNVALKFNLKLGGNNQAVEQSRLSFITEDKTMLVGIDVTHPSPGSKAAAPSVAGMVASIDKHLGQWPASLRTQEPKKEMVSDVGKMLQTHLDHWKTLGKHDDFPENIVVYRDGVSEGQYGDVLKKELPLLREACKQKYPKGKDLPNFTIIIVGKRHHTRFYATRDQDMDAGGNLMPGTVVDRGVTEEGNWDFFLQSHAVIQGTGRPAHYVVVLDEIFRARPRKPGVNVANEVEQLTQALCYTYSRATKAVSICTPAYHADLVCERARRYLADLFEGGSDAVSVVGQNLAGVTIHENLENTMYYI